MTPSRDLSRLIEIMAALRDPDGGCPWDLEQTHETIVPYTIEETYEVVDAIERKDMVDLCEELGDLLLQVVYHAQLAAERGEFEIGDVVEAITTKMVRRHPHVFGDEEARSAGSAKGMWERIKAEERFERAVARRAAGLPDDTPVGTLDGVPRNTPALMEAEKLQAKMAKLGFDWEAPAAIIDKVREEIDEIDQAISTGNRHEIAGEIGDLLFVVVNLARRTQVDPEAALRGTSTKVRSRFAHVERALAAKGQTFADATLEEMDEAWDEAKRIERQSSGS